MRGFVTMDGWRKKVMRWRPPPFPFLSLLPVNRAAQGHAQELARRVDLIAD